MTEFKMSVDYLAVNKINENEEFKYSSEIKENNN
jgi:hypothetical protein